MNIQTVRSPFFGNRGFAPILGVCVKTLPKVYNPKERPWIKMENATSEELMSQVSKCPSGALSYKKNN
jgi:uncharacterized Fe-S cluster protein YjdI